MAPKGNKKGSLFLLAALAAVMVVQGAAQVEQLVASLLPTKTNLYTDKMKLCVRGVVESSKNKPNRPGLVRLLFHDAFVGGLDASVLLLSTPFDNKTFASQNGLAKSTEQGSPRNGDLRGLDVFQEIRDTCSTEFGKIISCADAIAFAAREASYSLSNGIIDYLINGIGRLDGVVSRADEPGKNLPGADFNFDQLLASFTAKKSFEGKTIFGVKDLVSLSAAHSVGISHAGSYKDRVQNSTLDRGEINEDYQQALNKSATSPGFVANNVLNMKNPEDSVLNSSYYKANTDNKVVLQSDWVLRTKAETQLETYRDLPATWKKDFQDAMTKLSNELKTTTANSENNKGIRKICTSTNSPKKEDYPGVV